MYFICHHSKRAQQSAINGSQRFFSIFITFKDLFLVFSERSVTTETVLHCPVSWEKKQNMSGHGHQESTKDAKDEFECRRFCEVLPTCVALDFNNDVSAHHQCFLFLNKTTSLAGTSGTDHHILHRGCRNTKYGKFLCQLY